MSRPSSVQSRNLSLTEELEKLEQSITLTLQEIDHNFSKAHRIVTTSILPIVEDYAKHSEAVWEGSKFWKQFFEASANVSLSGYEETPEGDYTGLDETVTTDAEESQFGGQASSTKAQHAGTDDSISTADERPVSRYNDSMDDGSSAINTPTMTWREQETPRQSHEADDASEPSFANYPSPYESLKREFDSAQQGSRAAGGIAAAAQSSKGQQQPPTTPGRSRGGGGAVAGATPGARPSPFMSTAQRQTARNERRRQQQQQQQQQAPPTKPDPLLHHVLDKTYRIAATPHTARRRAAATTTETATASTTRRNPNTTAAAAAAHRAAARPAVLDDSSPFSPDVPAPQLRSEIFGSPSRGPRAGAGAPRTPGVSVQKRRTPRKPAAADHDDDEEEGEDDHAGARKTLFADARARSSSTRGNHDDAEDIITWDSDEDDDYDAGFDNFGISPPKTMQFHIPQSRLLQTPAREASRRIVEDLLLTAGAASVTSTMQSMDLTRGGAGGEGGRAGAGAAATIDDEWELEEDSPSVVRVARQEQDDITF